MTTKGEQSPAEQKEAVCGTCKGSGEFHYRAPHRFDKLVKTYPNCNSTGRIPAPVVPSDDECDHAWSAVGVSLERIQCLECREFAPPTPSQDAEGDGLAARGVRYRDGNVWVYEDASGIRHDVFIHDAVESAIREPYEALVARAALAVDELRVAIGYCDDTGVSGPLPVLLRGIAAELEERCACIEESLGGRKDG